MTSAIGDRSGLTLIELCLALSLAGLISSLAWPALRGFADRWEAVSRSRRFERRCLDVRRLALLTETDRNIEVSPWLGPPFQVSAPQVRFFGDGGAEPFSAESPTVSLFIDPDGRLRRTLHDEG